MSIKEYTPGPQDPQFWYNLKTGQVEEGAQDISTHLWGPFTTREEAASAMETARKRNEEYDANRDSWF